MIRALINTITGRDNETQETPKIETFNLTDVHAVDDSPIPVMVNDYGDKVKRTPSGLYVKKADYNPLDW